jgi:hypothetical protein
MLSLLLITALAVQYPPPASKPATDTTAAPCGTSQSAIGRQAFHDRMRELWVEHGVYHRHVIISASAARTSSPTICSGREQGEDKGWTRHAH